MSPTNPPIGLPRPAVPGGTVVTTGPLTVVDATNRLLAEPWSGYVGPRVRAQQAAVRSALEGKALAHAHGSAGSNSYDFAIVLRHVAADFSAEAPPGFTAIPAFGAASETLSFAAPLAGSWHFTISGDLAVTAKVKAGGVDVLNTSVAAPMGLGLTDLRIQFLGEMHQSQPAAMPQLASITLLPHVVLQGTGALSLTDAIDFGVKLQQGAITITRQVTNLSLGIGGGFDSRFEGTARLVLKPSPVYTATAFDLMKLTVATVNATFGFDGQLSFTLEHIGRLTTPFTLGASATLPVPGFMHDFLWMTAGRMPLPIPLQVTAPPEPVAPAPANTNFSNVAAQVWTGLKTSHAPYGAVLSIEHGRPDERLWGGRQFYCVEEDSAIWTGHLLAAASFRHASTGSSDALEMVKLALSGLERLFWVTQDAVAFRAATGEWRRQAIVSRARPLPVPMTTLGEPPSFAGIFARSALPDDSATRWWEAEDAIRKGRCYYERPEDGWIVVPVRHSGHETPQHFATYAEAEAYAANPGGSAIGIPGRPGDLEIRPVGRVWTGVGCGSSCTSDHPVSRDQYSGVLLGLYTAFQLVNDGDVHARAEALLVPMLHHVIDNHFNVALPPDPETICTSYFGAMDHQLALLRVAKSVNPADFGARYDEVSAAAEACWIPLWLSALDPIAAYYKYNLTHAVLVPLLMAEPDATLRDGYMRTQQILRAATETHRNAYFDLASILAAPPTARAAAAAQPPSYSSLPLSEVIKSTLADWIKRRDIVGETDGLPTDKTAEPGSQAALWHHGAYTTNSLDGGQLSLANYALALQQRPGSGRDYMWQRDPFQVGFNPGQSNPPTMADVTASDDNYREAPGVDYLLAYWLAVYLGVLSEPRA